MTLVDQDDTERVSVEGTRLVAPMRRRQLLRQLRRDLGTRVGSCALSRDASDAPVPPPTTITATSQLTPMACKRTVLELGVRHGGG